MEKRIEQKIQSLLNKQVVYGTHIIVIKGYDVHEEKERVYFHTNERECHYDRPFDGVLTFLNELKEVQGQLVQQQDVVDMAVTNARSISAQLKDVLLENIEKVRDNPEYIKQATSINNNVNSLINLQKLELDYVRTMKRYKGE